MWSSCNIGGGCDGDQDTDQVGDVSQTRRDGGGADEGRGWHLNGELCGSRERRVDPLERHRVKKIQ